jgi:hypothetical protein
MMNGFVTRYGTRAQSWRDRLARNRSKSFSTGSRSVRLVLAPDLSANLSARRETGGAELLKFGEPCNMAIPSQARPETAGKV